MSITHPSFSRDLKEYNQRLDHCLRENYGMTFRTWKTIKALTQLAGTGAAIYAMSLGADPMTSLVLATVMVSGPEVLEYVIQTDTTKE